MFIRAWAFIRDFTVITFLGDFLEKNSFGGFSFKMPQ